jgi:hypothetical protein
MEEMDEDEDEDESLGTASKEMIIDDKYCNICPFVFLFFSLSPLSLSLGPRATCGLARRHE